MSTDPSSPSSPSGSSSHKSGEQPGAKATERNWPSDPPYSPQASDRWTLEDDQALFQECALYIFRPAGRPLRVISLDRGLRVHENGFSILCAMADNGILIAKKALEAVLRDNFAKKCGINLGAP